MHTACAAAPRTAAPRPRRPRHPSPRCSAQLLPPSGAVKALAAASRPYAALLAIQEAALATLVTQLVLEPAFARPVEVEGLGERASAAGAAAAGWLPRRPGGPVRWVCGSAFAVTDAPGGFGTTRMIGWAGHANDCPHLTLEMGLLGDRVVGTLLLGPRADLVADPGYLQRYYISGTPSYNDVYNRCAALQAGRGWRHELPPSMTTKALLATAVSYTFPSDDGESIAEFDRAAQDVVSLWVGLVAGAQADGAPHPHARLYELRYMSEVEEDPRALLAANMFGQEATDRLNAITLGPAPLE